jgi:hypothetical protein
VQGLRILREVSRIRLAPVVLARPGPFRTRLAHQRVRLLRVGGEEARMSDGLERFARFAASVGVDAARFFGRGDAK